MKRAYLKLTKDDYRQLIKNESYEKKREKEEIEKIEKNPKICTICLNKIDFDAMANCSHSFCGSYFFKKGTNSILGDCIVQYWHSKDKTKLNCPNCRTAIHYIYFEERAVKDQNFLKILKNLYEYNNSFSKENKNVLKILCFINFKWQCKNNLNFKN